MGLFQEVSNEQAFLKAGMMGSAGSGKTYTATSLCIGLCLLGRERGLEFGSQPILFFDTETGSDWVAPRVREAGLKLRVAKTRAFTHLLDAVRESELSGGALLIDSITHVWREFQEAYMRARRRKYLEFQDWAELKAEWARFTTAFVNSQSHIILCGRAGYDYDHFVNDNGRKVIEKTGVKMKAESETGYEPNLLIYMERVAAENDILHTIRRAHVLKDRSTRLDGKTFDNPTFDAFLPHIECLNLGGTHVGVDTSGTSDSLFADDGENGNYAKIRRQREIALEEIEAELVRQWPGQTANEKKAKADTLEELFGTRSWTAIQSMDLERLRAGRNTLWQKLRGHPYGVAGQADKPAAACQNDREPVE